MIGTLLDEDFDDDEEEITDEVKELMKSHDLDQDDAEKVYDIMENEGLDEDEAIELKDEF